MSVDISGNGLIVTLTASNTYPVGVSMTQFADDADPLDVPTLQIADGAMGVNGDLIRWTKANIIKLSLSVIPASLNDNILSILLEANRAGQGKISAKDIIQMILNFPQGNIVTLTDGFIIDGMPSNSVASAGRLKSKTYNFGFQNKAGI